MRESEWILAVNLLLLEVFESWSDIVGEQIQLEKLSVEKTGELVHFSHSTRNVLWQEEVNFFRSVNLVKDGVEGRPFQYVTTDSVLVVQFLLQKSNFILTPFVATALRVTQIRPSHIYKHRFSLTYFLPACNLFYYRRFCSPCAKISLLKYAILFLPHWSSCEGYRIASGPSSSIL